MELKVENKEQDKLESTKQFLLIALGGVAIGRSVEFVRNFNLAKFKAMNSDLLFLTKFGFTEKEALLSILIIAGLVTAPIIGSMLSILVKKERK